MQKKFSEKSYFSVFIMPLGIFLTVAFFLSKAISWRIGQTYLEDDVAWFFPVIDQLLSIKLSMWDLIKSFHLPELTLFDSAYFAFLRFIFGYNFSLYPLPSFLIHLVNGVLIYQILVKGFQRSRFTAILASVIYLTFYGHYHAYLWPMAMHHMFGVFWILIFIYEYLKIINNGDAVSREKKLNIKLYVLALAASFMRLSILIIPLMIGTHIALSTSSKKDFFLKIKHWVPIFLIISWYQVVILLFGKHGDVLSSFLTIENFILLFGVFLFLWFLFRRNMQRIYYCWLMIPFIFILSLYLWIFPQKTLVSSVIALRWQVMPLPAGAAMWIFLAVFSLGVMYAFTRYVMRRDSRFGIFITWYLFLFPYLLFRLNEMPSRYLIYVSPVFAVVIAVFFGEMIVSRFKGFYRNIFQFIMAILFIWLSYVNIQSIHERSIRSFFTDYRIWNYENIKIANYIKQDQTKKHKIKDLNKNTLCLGGVSPLPYLVAWANHHLPEARIDGYESLRVTLQSVLGIDGKRIKINEACGSNGASYNFLNEIRLSEFQWIPDLREEDVWMGYGESFDGEDTQLHIDNVIQREINYFNNGKRFWSLVQGDWVERITLFDIYDFKGWYFAIPKGESFNLARFKIGDYKKSFFAKTRHELCTLITPRFSYDSRIASISQGGVQQKMSYSIPQKEHIFKINFFGIQLGYFYLKNEGEILRDGKKFCKISFELRPWTWLQKVSGDRIGVKAISLLDENDLMSVEFEQIDLMRLKKGKSGKKIIYHRNDLFMERRGYKEDVEFDTRDPLAAMLWILLSDYKSPGGHRTTFNINRKLFSLDVAPTFVKNGETLLNLKVNLLRKKDVNYNLSMVLNYGNEDRLPSKIRLKYGLINFSFIGL